MIFIKHRLLSHCIYVLSHGNLYLRQVGSSRDAFPFSLSPLFTVSSFFLVFMLSGGEENRRSLFCKYCFNDLLAILICDIEIIFWSYQVPLMNGIYW